MESRGAQSESKLTAWLRTPLTDERQKEIFALGDLTGLKADAEGFRGANFERAIILKSIVRERRPKRVLEIGTGRGFGSFAMLQEAAASDLDLHVTTADLLPADKPQRWPIRRNGIEEVAELSRADVFQSALLKPFTRNLREITGRTDALLPELHRSGERFDFIFIDAGHDVYSVVHDLAWSALLLEKGGCILMDDFAPLEDFGLGTCLVVSHARRFFQGVDIAPTDGVVFGKQAGDIGSRGMVLLDGLRGTPQLTRWKLRVWGVLSKLIELAHRPGLFPLAE